MIEYVMIFFITTILSQILFSVSNQDNANQLNSLFLMIIFFILGFFARVSVG